jgi:hypothetical protein
MVFCAFVVLVVFAGAARPADTITPQAKALMKVLDAMDVEGKWIAGEHVYWETGLPTGVPETSPGKHTHCSAFVAAAAKNLGVYILRPPEHGQKLLANAQNEWLAEEGAARGWVKLANAGEAQAAANRGLLVVASYHNHHDDRPGHIAIVRPGNKTTEQIAAEGPDVIQAGSVNKTSISIRHKRRLCRSSRRMARPRDRVLCSRSEALRREEVKLQHDPEKWKPVFGHDHAQNNRDPIQLNWITI